MATKSLVLPEDRFVLAVTAEDIAEGVRQDCWRCPVALALTRYLEAHNPRRRFSLTVDPTNAHLASPRAWQQLAAWNHDGRDFIYAFDRGHEVQPTKVTFWRTEVVA
jgi:hypothetical protein